MSLFSEIKRRNVAKVAIAYAAISWLIIQVVTSIEEPLGLPTSFDTIIIVLLAIAFPVALVLAWAYELTPEGIKPTESVAPEASITSQTGRRLTQITIGVLTLAVILLLADRFVIDWQSSPIPNSIAVMPFENRSPNEDDAYFAPGLRDEVSNHLSRIRSLVVIGEATMSQYQDTDKPLAVIANELSVEALLIASVSFAEGQIAIDTRLIDPRRDRTIWSDALIYPFENVFTIRSEIAMHVANAMTVAYSVEEQQQIESLPTTSEEAYARFLEARDSLGEGTAEGASRSLSLLREALALDENYVDAWTLIAQAHFLAEVYSESIEEADSHIREREAAVERAFSLDPNDTDVLVLHANLLFDKGDAEGAYAAYLRARESQGEPILSPIPLTVGYLKDSIAELEAVRDVDPLNPLVYSRLVVAHDAAGNRDRVRYWFERAHALGVETPLLRAEYMAFLLGSSQLEESRTVAAEIPDLPDFMQTRLDAIDDRESITRDVRALDAGNPTPIENGWIAIFAAYSGDAELALRQFSEREVALTRLWAQLYRDVRQLGEFRELMVSAGFVDVWRSHGWPDLCEPLENNDFICH